MALGKLSRFERLFSPTIIERGINYKNSGAVRQLIGQKLASDAITVNKRQQWSAIVYGSQRYPVQVTLTQMPDGDMTIDSLSCQCPYGDAYDDYCKHLVAVLLRIREQLKSGEAILEENAIIEDAIVNTNPVIDSEALLQSLDKPALQEFIQQCLLHHPHLLDELVIWASRYKEKAPEEDNSALRDPKVLQSMHRQVDAILISIIDIMTTTTITMLVRVTFVTRASNLSKYLTSLITSFSIKSLVSYIGLGG